MDPHESEGSDVESQQVEDSQSMARKRSSRACDQCRKTKSKCERPLGEGKKCKSCSLVGTACTFLGPSYKRGPPKGYIHAIEQRWHQVESLLGAILQCPDSRIKSVISDLRQDDLAREILDRVDMGPYGPSGRRMQSIDSTKEDFFASVLKSNEMSNSRDPSRALRQSREKREIVSSSQDHGLAVVPTKEWQDNLSRRLTSFSSSTLPSSTLPSSSSYASTSSYPRSDSYPNFNTDDQFGPVSQKRRVHATQPSIETPPDWSHMYTIDPNTDDEEFQQTTNELGQLSLDEHQEIRFHGKQSGLHLLGRSLRADDRIEGGIWRLPMARVWPASKFGFPSPTIEHVDAHLPPPEVQDALVDVYFAYIHPMFPILHKSRFLEEYRARRNPDSPAAASTYSTPRPEPTQEVTPLLLLAMFAIAARYREQEVVPPNCKMWEAGSGYVETARKMLGSIRNSRPSIVQALVLLGYREFGIGSMEQGWLLLGMGIRMAYDLGLNCDSSKWKIHNHDLFSPEESQIRRQIWWACCLADRYGSVYMGRPVMIREGDYDTPFPDVDPNEDRDLWQPMRSLDNISYHPTPGRVMSSFCAMSRLSVILGAIISQVYPIAPPPRTSRQTLLADLESRLDTWYHTLPDHLRYDTASRRTVPPPQILFLHIRYWAAVLLLHRAFIPNWKRTEDMGRQSTIGYRAFDLSRSAACHISSIVTSYRETFSLKRAPPFMTANLLSAGIMHILTMTLYPDNIESSLGLKQCLEALKDMEVAWPSASRAWELLNGVHLGDHNNAYATIPQQYDRNKRPADDAFGQDKNEFLQREAFGTVSDQPAPEMSGNANGVQEFSQRLMAHMLGLEIPGIEPSTSYFPGYEWWPRTNQGYSQQPPQPPAPSTQREQQQQPVPPPLFHSNSYPSMLPDHDLLATTIPGTSSNQQMPLSWMQPMENNNSQPALSNLHLDYPYDFQKFGVQ